MGSSSSENLKNAKWQKDGYICQISREKLGVLEQEMKRLESILHGKMKGHPAFYLSRARAKLEIAKQEQKVYTRNIARTCNTEAMREHPATTPEISTEAA